jgi:hypothetical protein
VVLANVVLVFCWGGNTSKNKDWRWLETAISCVDKSVLAIDLTISIKYYH